MTVDAKTMQAFITAMAAIQNGTAPNIQQPQQQPEPEKPKKRFYKSYFKCNILGNVGSDPVLRHTTKGTPVCNVSLCTNHQFQDTERKEWHKVTFWGEMAKNVVEQVRKGFSMNVWANQAVTSPYTNNEGVLCEGREYWATEAYWWENKKAARNAYTGDTTATTPAPQMEQNTNQNVDVNTMIEVMKQMGFVPKGTQEAPQEPAPAEDLAAQLNGGMSMGV